jgi:hypothetical protein
MMEAVRTSETSVDNHFTRQYIPEDNSEHHTRRRENLKSHRVSLLVWHLPVNLSVMGGPTSSYAAADKASDQLFRSLWEVACHQ